MTSLFSASIATWTGLFAAAIAVPLLIHLINLLRYRRVKWAAMEFLLQSQKRKRHRVWISQTLLILTRMALLIVSLILFTHLGCVDGNSPSWSRNTLHVVVIDDSYSMGQRSLTPIEGDGQQATRMSCFDRARANVDRLIERLVEESNQEITLISLTSPTEVLQDDIFPCDSSLSPRVRSFFEQHGLTEKAGDWRKKLKALREALAAKEFMGRSIRIHVLTDLRSRDWSSASQPDDEENAIEVLRSLQNDSVSCRLVDCGPESNETGNLLVRSLSPEHGAVSAGVPVFLNLEVENLSSLKVSNLKLEIRKSRIDPSTFAGTPEVEVEPTVLIPEIGPNETSVARLPVLFSEPGLYVVEAELPDDELSVDNVFQQMIEARPGNRVLLISDSGRADAEYLEWALRPRSRGAVIDSGFLVERRTPAEAMGANATSGSLLESKDYVAIFLVSDDISDPRLGEELLNYVTEGGFLVIIPGPAADLAQLNRLYHDRLGLLPFRIAGAIEISARSNPNESDIRFKETEFRKFFGGETAKLLPLATFQKKFYPPRDWSENIAQAVEVIAEVRGRATTPWVTRHRVGDGMVGVFLSPFDSEWNDWPKNPAFLVLLYQLIFRSVPWANESESLVGDRVSFPRPLSSSGNVADSTGNRGAMVNREAWFLPKLNATGKLIDVPVTTIDDRREVELRRRGIYPILANRSTSLTVAKLDLGESDLRVMDADAVEGSEAKDQTSRLESLPVESWRDEISSNDNDIGELVRPALLAFLILLILEPYLARKLSFHPSSGEAHG